MVSLNRNYSDGQSYPLYYSSWNNRLNSHISTNRTFACGESPLSLLNAWDRLLESTSDVLEFRSTSFNGPRNHISPHAELAVLFISILNRCQLLVWKCEANGDSADSSEKQTTRPTQILQSVHRDLIKLRDQVELSLAEFQCDYGTRELVVQLEEFYEVLSKYFSKRFGSQTS